MPVKGRRFAFELPNNVTETDSYWRRDKVWNGFAPVEQASPFQAIEGKPMPGNYAEPSFGQCLLPYLDGAATAKDSFFRAGAVPNGRVRDAVASRQLIRAGLRTADVKLILAV